MKKNKIPLKNRKKEIILMIIVMLILILFFSGYSMGKGYQKTNIDAKTKIAEPILVVENGPILEINGKNEKETYDFKVKNYRENGEINQIDLNYFIEILTPTQETISFKLYRGEEEITLENNKTQNRKLQKKYTQEDNYKLEILYDKNKNKDTKDILQDVQIKVHSEQIKV